MVNRRTKPPLPDEPDSDHELCIARPNQQNIAVTVSESSARFW